MTELERARIEEASRRHAYISKRHNPTTVLAIFDDLTVEGWQPPASPDLIAVRKLYIEVLRDIHFLPISESMVKGILDGAYDQRLKTEHLPFYLAGKNDRSNNFG